jgi:hypothetical protein
MEKKAGVISSSLVQQVLRKNFFRFWKNILDLAALSSPVLPVAVEPTDYRWPNGPCLVDPSEAHNFWHPHGTTCSGWRCGLMGATSTKKKLNGFIFHMKASLFFLFHEVDSPSHTSCFTSFNTQIQYLLASWTIVLHSVVVLATPIPMPMGLS